MEIQSGGEKMRNASGQQGENKRAVKRKVNENTYDISPIKPQAAHMWYVSLNEYINIHMDKLMRWVVETPMD